MNCYISGKTNKTCQQFIKLPLLGVGWTMAGTVSSIDWGVGYNIFHFHHFEGFVIVLVWLFWKPGRLEFHCEFWRVTQLSWLYFELLCFYRGEFQKTGMFSDFILVHFFLYSFQREKLILCLLLLICNNNDSLCPREGRRWHFVLLIWRQFSSNYSRLNHVKSWFCFFYIDCT